MQSYSTLFLASFALCLVIILASGYGFSRRAAFDEVADLYLLTDLDKAFVQDGIRYFGDKVARQRFMDLCQAELDRRALPHVKLSGSWQAREARAVAAIEQRFAVKAER